MWSKSNISLELEFTSVLDVSAFVAFTFWIFAAYHWEKHLHVLPLIQVNIKSLEDVVRAYLKLAEEKTEAAKEESQQMVLDIEDLDNIQTPER